MDGWMDRSIDRSSSFCHGPSSSSSSSSAVCLSLLFLHLLHSQSHVPLCPSIHRYVRPSVRYVRPSIDMSVHPSMHSSIRPSVCPPVHPPIHPSVCPSVRTRPSICMSIRAPAHPSIYLYVRPSTRPSIPRVVHLLLVSLLAPLLITFQYLSLCGAF